MNLKRVPLICKCGNVIFVMPSILKRQRYCSKDCRDKYAEYKKSSPENTVTRICVCGKSFNAFASKAKFGRAKHCSRKCAGVSRRAKRPLCKGCGNKVKLSKNEYCSWQCRAKHFRGENHYRWIKGDVNYKTLHSQIGVLHGRISKCEMCGTENAKKYDWASKGHTYTRNIEDWVRVCVSCHRRLDGKVRAIQKLDNNKNVVSEYEYAKLAALDVGLKSPSSIQKAAASGNKKAAGFYWRYAI